VRSFATEYGIPAAKPLGFTPIVIAGERTMPAAKTWSKAEFEDGMRVNPGLWRARFEAGKVKLNHPEILQRGR
jgi:hypothetical protein